MEKYKVVHIYEDAYGCEECPKDYVPLVETVLQAENGEIKRLRQEDRYLYSQNIREGDTVFINKNQELQKISS
ncbi:MAG: hypothetical protein MR364_08835 [Oscillospiraceae bacterium]|nr:hypothetical protein [Oscillospiraceae bacterium]